LRAMHVLSCTLSASRLPLTPTPPPLRYRKSIQIALSRQGESTALSGDNPEPCSVGDLCMHTTACFLYAYLEFPFLTPIYPLVLSSPPPPAAAPAAAPPLT
jgi:hypothetical protein